jgi:uncharacterized phage-associated protein
MRSVASVACYFLHQVDREAGDTISPLKLQKLVYYAQAWSMVLRGEALFPDPIEAWMHGPVVRTLWELYKDYKHRDIPQPTEPCPEFTSDELEVLEEVWSAYGELSARQLEHLTHSEEPWLEARRGLDPGDKSQNKIPLEHMQLYYERFLVQQ